MSYCESQLTRNKNKNSKSIYGDALNQINAEFR